MFTNLLLADEINRATPKTQSALLEVMEERCVTVDGTTHVLPPPFQVLATMNPLDHQGTYALPAAQIDRFMVMLEVGYPSADDEVRVLDRHLGAESALAGVAAGDRARRSRRLAGDRAAHPRGASGQAHRGRVRARAARRVARSSDGEPARDAGLGAPGAGARDGRSGASS